jgi:hypothetical protein
VSEQETGQELFLPQYRKTNQEFFLVHEQKTDQNFLAARRLKCCKFGLQILLPPQNRRL